MFQNWGFLLGEIWGLVLIAALLGLFCGWLIWSRRKDYDLLKEELETRERELATSRGELTDMRADYDTQVARLSTVENERVGLIAARDDALGGLEARDTRIAELQAQLHDHESAAANWQSERTTLIGERESGMADLSSRDGQIAQLQRELAETSEKLGNMAAIEKARDEANAARAKAESAHAEEIFRLRQADEDRSRLRNELAAAAGSAASVAALEAKLADASAAADQASELESRLASREADISARDQEIAELRAQLAAAASQAEDPARVSQMQSALDQCRNTVASRDAVIDTLRAQMDDAVKANTKDDSSKDYDGDGVLEGRNEGSKPQTLTAARGGKADDLKKIKGVGPKLEGLLHKLGFFHFDQIAGWTRDEVAWVDANLDGFNGRVSRDRWIEQAKVLASGGTTEFAARVEGGDVYD